MLNKAQIIGRIGKDPETRYLPNGDAVTNITVATSETWKDKNGEKQEKTEWHRITFFRKLAEIAGQYLKKGALVYVEGKIETKKWTDKSGVEKYSTEINAHDMKMLSGKQSDSERESQPQSKPEPKGDFSDMDSDIPF